MSALFLFNVTAPTEIYTLPLPDALPICRWARSAAPSAAAASSTSRSARPKTSTTTCGPSASSTPASPSTPTSRSEEHTSELQSRQYLVCRLLLEKNRHVGTDVARIALAV